MQMIMKDVKIMTFDEAIEELRLAIPKRFYSPTMHDIAVMVETQTKVINLLREEYAPTIEMTKAQRDLILRNQDEDRLYEILGDGDGYYFNAEYWCDLEPHEVAQAYLHPETIKVVDE